MKTARLNINEILDILNNVDDKDKYCYNTNNDNKNIHDYSEVLVSSSQLQHGDRIFYYWSGEFWYNFGYFCIVGKSPSNKIRLYLDNDKKVDVTCNLEQISEERLNTNTNKSIIVLRCPKFDNLSLNLET